MKKTIALLSLIGPILLPRTTAGQSQFLLANREPSYGIDAPVLDAQGAPLNSPNFVAELWGGATSDSLSPALSAYSGVRVIVPFSTDPVRPTGGYFRDPYLDNRGYSTIANVRPNTEAAWLQVRAWDTRLGATYEAVVAAGLGGYGESPIFSAVGTDPYLANPALPARLIGLESFSLRAEVPEPTTWMLLALVGGSVGWTLRRQRR